MPALGVADEPGIRGTAPVCGITGTTPVTGDFGIAGTPCGGVTLRGNGPCIDSTCTGPRAAAAPGAIGFGREFCDAMPEPVAVFARADGAAASGADGTPARPGNAFGFVGSSSRFVSGRLIEGIAPVARLGTGGGPGRGAGGGGAASPCVPGRLIAGEDVRALGVAGSVAARFRSLRVIGRGCSGSSYAGGTDVVRPRLTGWRV